MKPTSSAMVTNVPNARYSTQNFSKVEKRDTIKKQKIKHTNKEMRQKQNSKLYQLLAPKNASLIINEIKSASRGMTVYENITEVAVDQFSACVDLTINGTTYKGYGSDKKNARDAAAEQAIRDLYINKMKGAPCLEVVLGDMEPEEQPPTLFDLVNLALHKLFAEWKEKGYSFPQLHAPVPKASPKLKKPIPKEKRLPLNASSMHPSMLLAYMRRDVGYRHLSVEGAIPGKMIFAIGVDINGSTYVGKGTSKKEARRQAAMAACSTVWGVCFTKDPTENVPRLV